jgi:excisionase family DNA binding protein
MAALRQRRHNDKATPEYAHAARLVGMAIGIAKVGGSARSVRRAADNARAIIDRRIAKLADDDSPEAVGETLCLDRLLDVLDLLLSEGPRDRPIRERNLLTAICQIDDSTPRTPCPTLSVAEAAEELGIHRTTLYSLIERGQAPFPVLRLGRRIRISQFVLDTYLRCEEVG